MEYCLHLFALYVDGVIKALRNSGYGIFVGNTFAGCILYADDMFYCLVVFVVYRKWLMSVLSMELVGILSLFLLKVSV